MADAAGQDQRPAATAAPGLNLDRGRRRDQVREIRACNEVLSHIPNRSSPVGARTGAPRNEGYLPPAGERGNERHRLGRSHLCDSSGFRSLASIARCLLPGLGSPSSVSLHGRSSFGSPLVRQTSTARRVRAEAQPRRAAISESRAPRRDSSGLASDCRFETNNSEQDAARMHDEMETTRLSQRSLAGSNYETRRGSDPDNY